MEFRGPRNTANLEGKIAMDDIARKESGKKYGKKERIEVSARALFHFG